MASTSAVLRTGPRAHRMAPVRHTPRATAKRRVAGMGSVAATCGALGLILMQLLPAGRALNPMSEPLSKYAFLGTGWVFDASVCVLALGATGVLVALVLARLAPVRSVAFAALCGCSVGLAAVVVFPDVTTQSGQLTEIGWLHLTAAVIAFAGAPVATVALARRHDGHHPGARRYLRIALWSTIAAGLCLVAFVGGAVIDSATTVPVWRVGGALERALTVLEIVIAIALSRWVCGGCSCRRDAATGRYPQSINQVCVPPTREESRQRRNAPATGLGRDEESRRNR